MAARAAPTGAGPGFDPQRAREIIAGHAGMAGATLPILHALQAEFGWVPQEALPLVADALNLTRAEVFGVVSFYHDFLQHPPARHTLKLCRAEACQSVGGAALAVHAQARLGISWHEQTADGAVALQPVFCLGLCATGPAAMADGELVGRLDRPRLDALIDGMRRR